MREIYDLTEEEKAVHEKKFGGFNDFPPNWHEITEAEFAQSIFFSYSPVVVEYRQMHPKEGKMVSGHLHFFHDDTGFAIINDYWAKTVRYYRFFVCDHEYDELSADEARKRGVSHFGMCYHVYECKHCKRIMSVDSSG